MPPIPLARSSPLPLIPLSTLPPGVRDTALLPIAGLYYSGALPHSLGGQNGNSYVGGGRSAAEYLGSAAAYVGNELANAGLVRELERDWSARRAILIGTLRAAYHVVLQRNNGHPDRNLT
jgi:hypothetical protein